jgi:hypothetical protein
MRASLEKAQSPDDSTQPQELGTEPKRSKKRKRKSRTDRPILLFKGTLGHGVRVCSSSKENRQLGNVLFRNIDVVLNYIVTDKSTQIEVYSDGSLFKKPLSFPNRLPIDNEPLRVFYEQFVKKKLESEKLINTYLWYNPPGKTTVSLTSPLNLTQVCLPLRLVTLSINTLNDLDVGIAALEPAIMSKELSQPLVTKHSERNGVFLIKNVELSPTFVKYFHNVLKLLSSGQELHGLTRQNLKQYFTILSSSIAYFKTNINSG